MTPKIRFSPSASSASRPASRMPLRIASRKKMSSWQSIGSRPRPWPWFETRCCAPLLTMRSGVTRVLILRSGRRPRLEGWRHALPHLSNPHVRLADLVAGEQFLRRSACLDAPDLEQVGAVGDLEHLAHVLFD